ncbi:adenosylcobinamide-GDP ribazoletransferase [Rhizorhapis sp.]|uniref:adenosylcobinamide-GDP ribazoletransferase n=1 Tax=Rhizorhapis sp. TaxID=1968842 RepID=UPI002B45A862|nr:adenosylcobinamide-GDP ribazoletransferase [Rhizorhapis sp.]HKR17190.1 adenosylcobinamide-GDP ribazoletransferase [Rhizorhapis sp.]
MTEPLRSRWWVPPLLALQFLTRIQVKVLDAVPGAEVAHGLKRSPIWFPLVGTLIGCITAAVLVGADALWPLAVAVLIALAIEARLTGAFHEDAVADFCDALGGGYDRRSTLRILKDSRVGSYGAVGLILAIGLRASLLVSLPSSLLVWAIVASACFGRLVAVATMTLIPPPQEVEGLAGQVRSSTHWPVLALAALLSVPALLPLALKTPLALAGAFAGAAIFLLWLHRMLMPRLGGATGDCLGFAAYAGQLILLLAVAAG